MERRAQLNQVFTIIATLLIAGAIIFIGARLIGGAMSTKCDSDFIRFQDDLNLAIKNNNNYGSVTKESLSIPCKSQMLCLVNTASIKKEAPLDMPSGLSSETKFIIENSVEDDANENVFLVSDGETMPLKFSPNIMLEKDVLCIRPKSGDFVMIMTGQGRQTLITSQNDITLNSVSTGTPASASEDINSRR